MIRSEKIVTFKSLVEKFDKKASRSGIFGMKPSLNIMLGLYTHIDELKSRCERLDRLMNQERKIEILKKVPSTMLIEGKLARDSLQSYIDLVNFANSLKVLHLNYEISLAIDFSLANQNFVKSYQNWKLKKVNEKHMLLVKDTLDSLEVEFVQLHEFLTMAMSVIDETKRNIGTMTALLNSKFNRLLTITESAQITEVVEQITHSLIEIHKKQDLFVTQLESIRNILNYYNAKRVTWAEFLIGMRDLPIMEPKPVILKKREYIKQIGRKYYAKYSLTERQKMRENMIPIAVEANQNSKINLGRTSATTSK